MTDPRTPDHLGPVDPDVELASAHLDGEVGADERARAQGATVQGHAAALRSVVDQVRDVPPPPAGLLDDHVALAMAAFDDEGRVVPLARRSTRPWWQRIPLGAVAAAVVVIALFGAIGLASQGQDDDSATASLDSAGDAAETSAGGEATTSQDDGGETLEDVQREAATFEAGAGIARPIYDDVDDLAEDLRSELAAPGGSTDAAPDPSAATTTAEADEAEGSDGAAVDDPCDAVDLLGLDPSTVVLVRSVVVSSDEVTAVVHDPDGDRRLTVVDDASCTVVLERSL